MLGLDSYKLCNYKNVKIHFLIPKSPKYYYQAPSLHYGTTTVLFCKGALERQTLYNFTNTYFNKSESKKCNRYL